MLLLRKVVQIMPDAGRFYQIAQKTGLILKKMPSGIDQCGAGMTRHLQYDR